MLYIIYMGFRIERNHQYLLFYLLLNGGHDLFHYSRSWNITFGVTNSPNSVSGNTTSFRKVTLCNSFSIQPTTKFTAIRVTPPKHISHSPFLLACPLCTKLNQKCLKN